MNGRLMNRLLSCACAVIVAQSIHGMEQKAIEPAAASAGSVRERFEIQPSCYDAFPSEPSGYHCVSGDGRPHSVGILCLPLDVVEHISSYLSLKDIAALRGSCKQFATIWDHERELRFEPGDLKRYARQYQGWLRAGLAYLSSRLQRLFNAGCVQQDQEWLRAGLILLRNKLQADHNPVSLNLYCAGLTDLPEEIQGLQQLKELSLGGDRLSQEAVKKLGRLLPGLQELNLYCAGLTDLPEEIQGLQHLKRLNLEGNRLSQEAIKKLSRLPGLQELGLTDASLTDLPEEIQGLQHLKKINLRDNRLSQEAIRKLCRLLPGLQELNLYYAGLTDLPEEIQGLQHLKRLNLGGNRLSQEAIKKLCRLLPGLQELGLGHNGLTDLPEEIQGLQHLKRLNLEGNRLSEEEKQRIRAWLPGTYIEF